VRLSGNIYSQETESRAYADTLSRLIGVPVTPPRI
jgi:hypothetical protein